ncbi:hypothetical protein HK098_002096 [Nowakowskiella sp. JEL0407]|nr:hypothetical protein HK098_002096 [Nowakowskiella sp. JEL0407]
MSETISEISLATSSTITIPTAVVELTPQTPQRAPSVAVIAIAVISGVLVLAALILCALNLARFKNRKEISTPISHTTSESSTAISPTTRSFSIGLRSSDDTNTNSRTRILRNPSRDTHLQEVFKLPSRKTPEQITVEHAAKVRVEYEHFDGNVSGTSSRGRSFSSLYTHSNPDARKKGNTSATNSPNLPNRSNIPVNEIDSNSTSNLNSKPTLAEMYSSPFTTDFNKYEEINQTAYKPYPRADLSSSPTYSTNSTTKISIRTGSETRSVKSSDRKFYRDRSDSLSNSIASSTASINEKMTDFSTTQRNSISSYSWNKPRNEVIVNQLRISIPRPSLDAQGITNSIMSKISRITPESGKRKSGGNIGTQDYGEIEKRTLSPTEKLERVMAELEELKN